MNNAMLSALMQVLINGTDLFTPACKQLIQQVVKEWKAAKNRRGLPMKPKQVKNMNLKVVEDQAADEAAQIEQGVIQEEVQPQEEV